ncbi:hypothetical protein [Pseudemcibacter aquimaris]|uniref:hypothetical protein n=1 Tax=Pseudemcibacter aquimaris TaxID=2857064 RepID=UPI002012E94A|nr:hypothetical protein [Pseudemcibacter aquimaris]MCC3861468.1 hypothetical protein [Pseudemcibacter aquimaris]WDU58237.1 hypothetical protein KW060_13680 [Pseudemcibacter aquimaris]
MKNTLNTLKISFFLIFLNFFTANAQNPLNSSEIERYLSSLKTIETALNAYEKQNPDAEKESILNLSPNDMPSKTPISGNLKSLEAHPTYPNFIEAIKKHNFNSAAEWANTGDRIMNAHAAYHLNNPPPGDNKSIADIINEMESQKETIAKNRYISNDQKQTLLQKIENGVALLNDPNYINNENIKIISPYIKRLNSLFEEPQ